MAVTIRSPQFVIENTSWATKAEKANLEATSGRRWTGGDQHDDVPDILEADLFGWRLYNDDESVAWSLGKMFLDDCRAMVEWFRAPLHLAENEMWDWKPDDRSQTTTKEWLPVEPFFEIHLSRPSGPRKTTMARWRLVNGGEWAAVSAGDLFQHECKDFLARIQDEMDVPILERSTAD